MAHETSVFSYFNHLTRLVAREDFIIYQGGLLPFLLPVPRFQSSVCVCNVSYTVVLY
jgi:hypothetical protein